MMQFQSVPSHDIDVESTAPEPIESNVVTSEPASKDAVNQPIYAFRNQAEKIEHWLRQYGFAYNPFRFTNSERDRNLTEHFFEHPDFEKMLGLDDRLLFARTGDGKTATRLRLQSFYRDSVRDRHVFAFSYLIPQDIAAKSLPSQTDHIEAILTAAVRHAFVFFALRGVDLPMLQNEKTAQPLAQHFATYFDQYYGVENLWRLDLHQAIMDYSLRQVVNHLDLYDDLDSPDAVGGINIRWLKQWLQWLETGEERASNRLPAQPAQRWQQFYELVQASGIRTLLVLVDGVDVKPGHPAVAADDPAQPHNEHVGRQAAAARMMAIINPLLAMIKAKTLGQHVAWKLFLPMELYLPLAPDLAKHFAHDILYWDHLRLRELLRFRLRVVTDGAVTTLLQLAEEDVPDDLETFLIVRAALSPRYLIHYINQIFGMHVEQTGNHTLPGKLSGTLFSQIHYTPHRPT
jgi:hypothetical protein